jgi:hypothetical protein
LLSHAGFNDAVNNLDVSGVFCCLGILFCPPLLHYFNIF